MNRVELTWKNLTLTTNKNKHLLDNVSGQIKPGEIKAIIGPSGSGKTTLLNSLAGRIPTNLKLEGEILANGRDRDAKQWPNLIAYVNQQFFALENQTVYETLTFSASAKLPLGTNIAEKVEEALLILNLDSVRESRLNTLSGGEKVIVSIGIEFIGDPAVLFADEPTSGLDSFNALNVLDILQKLAKMNKTVVLTIHQPSYKMLQKIDSIYIMAKGSPIFDGSIADCIDFFDQAGFKLEQNDNPSDFFLNTIALNTSNSETIEESYRIISKLKNNWRSIQKPYDLTITDQIEIKVTRKYFTIFNLLLKREIVDMCRNTAALAGKFFQKLIIGLLFGFTYFRLGISNANIISLRGIITFIFIQEFFGISGPILNQFGLYKKILERERMSGFYSGPEAYFAKFLATTLFTFVFEIPFILFVYYLVGLNSNFGIFMIFLLIVLAACIFSISFGLTIGILSSDIETSQIIGVTLNVTYIIYSGSFLNPNTIPGVLRWLIWLSPAFYAFSAAFQNQLNGQTVNGASGEELIDSFGLNKIGILPSTMILLGWVLFYQLLGAIGMEFKLRNNLKIKKPNINIETVDDHI